MRTVVFSLALVVVATPLPAVAQASSPIVQLMPPVLDEEQDLERERNRRLLSQAGGALPAPIAQFLKEPKPPRQQTLRNLLSDPMMDVLDRDYPGRTIPVGKIIEASVLVRLPDGKTAGPYRMFSSMAPGHAPHEYANGVSYGIPAKLPALPKDGSLPKFDPDGFKDMMFFDADGDERFIGAMLGSVATDGTIAMNFAMIVEGRPMRIVRASGKSGLSIEISAPGGYRFTIRPVLRGQKPIEQRWNRLAKEQHAQEARSPHSTAGLRQISPEWPGPAHVRSGPLYFTPFANMKVSCGDWRSKFTNDPAVDVSKLGGTAATLVFDKEGLARIDAPSRRAAFKVGAFPDELAAVQVADTMKMPTSVSHHGGSPALADVLDFHDLDQALPVLSWQRIRREDGIIYTTKVFVRCKKQ